MRSRFPFRRAGTRERAPPRRQHSLRLPTPPTIRNHWDYKIASVADRAVRASGRELASTSSPVSGRVASRQRDRARSRLHHRDSSRRSTGMATPADRHYRAGDRPVRGTRALAQAYLEWQRIGINNPALRARREETGKRRRRWTDRPPTRLAASMRRRRKLHVSVEPNMVALESSSGSTSRSTARRSRAASAVEDPLFRS